MVATSSSGESMGAVQLEPQQLRSAIARLRGAGGAGPHHPPGCHLPADAGVSAAIAELTRAAVAVQARLAEDGQVWSRTLERWVEGATAADRAGAR